MAYTGIPCPECGWLLNHHPGVSHRKETTYVVTFDATTGNDQQLDVPASSALSGSSYAAAARCARWISSDS